MKKIIVKISAIMMCVFLILGASSFSVFADENTNVITVVTDDENANDFVNDTDVDDEIKDPSKAITEDEITDPSATTDGKTVDDSVGIAEQEPNITYMSTANGVYEVSSETLAVLESIEDETAYVPGELLVVYDDNVASLESVGTFSAETEGIASVETIDEIDVVKVTLDEDTSMRDKIIEISADPGVSYVQPNYFYYLDDTIYDDFSDVTSGTESVAEINAVNTNDTDLIKQPYLDQMNFSEAWKKVLASTPNTVRVAILDSGARISHEEFDGHILTEYCRDVTRGYGFSGIEYPLQTEDDDGHGTYVSSIIGATANNGKGIVGAATCGIDSGTPLEFFCVDVFSDAWFGNSTTEYVALGIAYAKENGARIINMSLGKSMDTEQWTDEIAKAVIDAAYDQGVICVCSAGNFYSDSTPVYPSDYEKVISVTSLCTISYDSSTRKYSSIPYQDYLRSDFSSFNSNKDVCAPGSYIYAAYKDNDSSYIAGNGTSSAAPLVSSVIALMLMVNPNLTFDDVYEIITSTATDIVYGPRTSFDENGENPFMESAGVGYDIYTGYGLVDAEACVSYVINGGLSATPDWSYDTATDTLTINGYCSMPDYTAESPAPWVQYKDQVRHIVIGNGVQNIGSRAFYCFGSIWYLRSLTIGTNVKKIGDEAFFYCYARGNLVLPKVLKEIGTRAFCGCDMLRGDLVIPDSVTSIGDSAFANCRFDGTLTIGSGLTKISSRCFHGNNFSGNLTIPDSITEIGSGAFEGCKKITRLTLNENISKIDAYTFSGCTALTGTVMIPDSVQTIGFNAFYECSNITGLVIGTGAKEIKWNAFNYCKNLQSIVVNAANTVYDSRNNCNAIIETAKKRLVVGCKGTVIPEGIETIYDYSFKGNLIDAKEIILPQSLKTIGSYAFYDCTGLTGTLVIPNNVWDIGFYAFYKCGITGLILGNNLTDIGRGAFDECKNLTGNLVIPDSVTELWDGAFADTGFTSVVIGKGVSTIEQSTFSGCKSLESVSFTANVKTIKDSAFKNCSKLKDVHYSGTETQKQSITIGSDNEPLINATWHCAGGGGANFDDVSPGDWFAPSVDFVYSRGIMKGMGGTKDFAPYDPLQREQLAIMLYRLEGTPKTTYVGRFNDVPNGTWYTDAIMWAYSKGVITGYQNGNFGVGDCITREQFATMLYRYANYKGLNTSGKANISGYLDAGLVSGWAYDAISWAVGNGIITGKDNKTRLDPLGNAARCECAAMIQRFMEKYGL